MKYLLALFAAACAGSLTAGRAVAQVQPPNADRPRYEALWYATFAPRTALDMVRQTPGFALAEGQEDRRGLSGAVGNVLIDGRRPSAKEQTLEEILQRIPAGQVQAIEILRGADTGGDASGQAVLLNLVRTPFTGQGVGSLGFEYSQQHEPAPNGWTSWTGRAHSVDYAIGASTYSLARELPGIRRLLDADGVETGTRRDTSPRDFAEYALNGEAGMDAGGGNLRLTGQASYSRYHEDSAVATFDSSRMLSGTDLNPYTESKRGAEFGGHFDREMGAWQLAGLALLTRSRFESEVTSTNEKASGVVASAFAQQLARISGETILRFSLARELGARQRLEFGIEGALNTLDADLALTFDAGGGAFEIPVPNSNVRIEERRTEAFVNHTWRMNERWSLDWRMAAEYSRLAFSGDSNQIVTLSFAKPSLQLTRSFGANQLRFRLVRDVGQLDFTDFVSSASLGDKRIDGGNPDLEPQTQWSAEFTADLRPGKDVALTFNAFHRWVDDTTDFTPVGPPDALVDAPGNVGAARIYGAHLMARAPLPFMRGGSVNVESTWQHSSVTDPLTLRRREISEFQRLQLTGGFRQDLPKLAWGLNYTMKARTSAYLLHEIDRNRESPSFDAFVETPLPRGLRLRFAAVSLLGQAQTRERLFFDTDRRKSGFSAERGARDPGTWCQLSVSGSF